MVRFFDAHLLAVPMRADLNPYYLCVSPKSIETYVDMAKAFGVVIDDTLQKIVDYEGSEIVVKNGTPVIEDTKAKEDKNFPWEALEKLVGEPVAIVPNVIFESLLDDLPIIARNQLENGESKNLFYEEVLPRKSKFFTIISFPTYLNIENKTRLQNSFDKFCEYITSDNLIQIGANASIGYGVTKFRENSYA
jgi:CRISPR-associated protein Cmr4